MPEGAGTEPAAGGHMNFFDPAYKIDALRDWLFDQSK